MQEQMHHPSVARNIFKASTGKFQLLGHGLLAVVSWGFILANLARLWGLYRNCGPDGSGCHACYTGADLCEMVSCTSDRFAVTEVIWDTGMFQWALLATMLYSFSLLLRVCEYTFLYRPHTGIAFYPKSRIACFGMVLVSFGCYNPHLLLDADRKAAIQEQELLSQQGSGNPEAFKTVEDDHYRLGLSEQELDKDTAVEHATFTMRVLIEGVVFVLNQVIMSNGQVMTHDFSTDWALLANCTRQVVVLAYGAVRLGLLSPKSEWSHALLPRCTDGPTTIATTTAAAATAAANAPSSCSPWGSLLNPNYIKLFLQGPGVVMLLFNIGAVGSTLLVYAFAALNLDLAGGQWYSAYGAFLLLLGRFGWQLLLNGLQHWAAATTASTTPASYQARQRGCLQTSCSFFFMALGSSMCGFFPWFWQKGANVKADIPTHHMAANIANGGHRQPRPRVLKALSWVDFSGGAAFSIIGNAAYLSAKGGMCVSIMKRYIALGMGLGLLMLVVGLLLRLWLVPRWQQQQSQDIQQRRRGAVQIATAV